ncbi:MAG: RluA family pseudouridine synthase [Candidatus Rokuibacteriota bacterium]
MQALHPASSRTTLRKWLAAGRVRVNGVVVRRGDRPVDAGDRLQLGPAPPPAFPAPLRLVHEDDDLLVVDKPPGLLTIATAHERERTVYRLLSDYVAGLSGRRIFIVHRLDRETSGLLVFARSPDVKRHLQSQFEARSVERLYVAVVEGRVREASGVLRGRLVQDPARRVRPTRDPRRGQEAITRYRVLAHGRDTTRLELSLVTGRRGQIRVQLAELGHPIVGDRLHGSRRDPLRRLCLHATRLAFTDPRGRRVHFESRPPAGFQRLA